jgi:hypothetical protein
MATIRRVLMGKITIDSGLEAKLAATHDTVEVCGSAGQTMGRYVPEELFQKLVYQLAESHRPGLTEQEVQARRQMPGHKSLAQILQNLEKP